MRKMILVLLLATLLSPFAAFAHQDPDIAGYVDVPGGRIWYRLNGHEHLGKKPALIVIHGGPGGSHRMLMPFVELADERAVILYDQLDCGNSDQPNHPGNWTVDRFVAEIEALRRHLRLSRVIVAGHSWGGALAAEYAVRHPNALSGLILASPLISASEWMADASALLDELDPQTRDTLRRHIAAGTFDSPDYIAAERTFYARHLCRANPCPGGEYLQGSRNEFNPTLYRYMWGPSEFHVSGTLSTYDVSHRLGNVRVPTLVICGEFDEARPETCRRHGARIPNAAVAIVPNAAHAAVVEQKATFLSTVREFLNRQTR
jgi:L-proline amide hydrolase